MKLEIKIPVGFASKVVTDRDLHGERQKYRTNRTIKLADTWLVLKSLTTSGKIQNYKDQLESLAEICKVSEWTLRNRLKQLKEMQLVKFTYYDTGCRYEKDLLIANWNRFLDEFLIDTRFVEYHIVAYDSTEQKKTLEYAIRAIEFEENRYNQMLAIRSQLQKNPQLFNQLCVLMMKHVPGCKPEDFSDIRKFIDRLFWLQKHSFKHWPKADNEGSKYVYELINQINACLDRSAKGIRRSHGYKSCLSTTYLKRQLTKRGFAELRRNSAHISTERQRKPKECLVNYESSSKATKWHLPDSLRIKPLNP